ncbi:hypothetical protein [uncultured Winogradskyella sp.]|uniref:hypothetical protein n=1 Tax=uncultured Winogradskyella sp. TaxID=395353 RepID=UPI002618E946|nr:hypothetical protein [uncultured Winogradskyella sp.]
MKFLKYLPLLLFVFMYSCSNSDDSEEGQQQENGSVSITFSDGRSYILDQINATYNDYYELGGQQQLKITATSSDPSVTGTLNIELYDNTSDNQNFVDGASVPFQITPADTFGTLNFIDNNSTFIASTGALEITHLVFNTGVNPENIIFSASIDTSNGSGLILLGNILNIKMFCAADAECGG